MQFGLIAEGIKDEVLRSLEYQVMKQKEKFERDCLATLKPIYGEGGLKGFDPYPLPYEESLKAIDQIYLSVKEQLLHVDNNEEIAVSVQLTIHRPNP